MNQGSPLLYTCWSREVRVRVGAYESLATCLHRNVGSTMLQLELLRPSPSYACLNPTSIHPPRRKKRDSQKEPRVYHPTLVKLQRVSCSLSPGEAVSPDTIPCRVARCLGPVVGANDCAILCWCCSAIACHWRFFRLSMPSWGEHITLTMLQALRESLPWEYLQSRCLPIVLALARLA